MYRVAHLHEGVIWPRHRQIQSALLRNQCVRAAAAGRTVSRSDIDVHETQVDLKPPKGTRDFYPDEMRMRKWLFGEFAHVSELFGFEQYDSPVLENEGLFIRKAGEEIREQLFNFRDKGDRPMALRPELTPSLARMVLAKGSALPLPVKWYNIGQCWRYERMTRGRRREHYQWNMDIIGSESIAAEAELLAAMTTLFKRLGLTSKEVVIKVNNRQVLQALASKYGVPDNIFSSVCVVLDKVEKLPRTEVVKQLEALGLSSSDAGVMLDIMASREIGEVARVLGADAAAIRDLQQLFQLAEGYGYVDWLQYDASIVRGLAYYTGTVFEAFDREGTLRAICGGGRYDKLLATFGGEDQPMVGFGFGDAVIMELLQHHDLLPAPAHSVQDIVLCMDPELRHHVCMVATRLRDSGRRVDMILDTKKLKWAFKHAERIAAERLILIGQQEWGKGCVRVKELAERKEYDVRLEDIA